MTDGLDLIIPGSHPKDHLKRQHLERLWWAILLIWAGLVLGAQNRGYLPEIGEASTWSWIFLGGGIAALVGAVLREISKTIPKASAWDWIWGGYYLIVGLGGFIRFKLTLPLILILAGCGLFARSLWTKK